MAEQALGNMSPDRRDAYLDRQYDKALATKPVEEMPSPEASSANAMAAQQAMNTVQSAQVGQSGASTAGQGLMGVGAATANPYLIAGGAALSTIGSIQDKKAKAKQDKLQRTQQALANLQALGSNFRL